MTYQSVLTLSYVFIYLSLFTITYLGSSSCSRFAPRPRRSLRPSMIFILVELLFLPLSDLVSMPLSSFSAHLSPSPPTSTMTRPDTVPTCSYLGHNRWGQGQGARCAGPRAKCRRCLQRVAPTRGAGTEAGVNSRHMYCREPHYQACMYCLGRVEPGRPSASGSDASGAGTETSAGSHKGPYPLSLKRAPEILLRETLGPWAQIFCGSQDLVPTGHPRTGRPNTRREIGSASGFPVHGSEKLAVNGVHT